MAAVKQDQHWSNSLDKCWTRTGRSYNITPFKVTSRLPSQPGSDSGTTAVVALIRGKQLIVANAGDSRCVVSERGGPGVSAPARNV